MLAFGSGVIPRTAAPVRMQLFAGMQMNKSLTAYVNLLFSFLR